MNAVLPFSLYSDLKPLERKVLSAWGALERRYSQELSEPEIDYLYALYVMGLTVPLFGHREPSQHLDACRILLRLRLTPERSERALTEVPAASADWVLKAFSSIEQLGIRDGHALLDPLRNLTPAIDDASRPAAGEHDEAKDKKHV